MHHEHCLKFPDDSFLSSVSDLIPFGMSALTFRQYFCARSDRNRFRIASCSAEGWWIGVFGASELPLRPFPIVVIALPSTPVSGGVNCWMTGMPFFVFLQMGLSRTVGAVAPSHGARGLTVVLEWFACSEHGQRERFGRRAARVTMSWRRPSRGGFQLRTAAVWGGQTRLGLEYLDEHAEDGKVYFKSPGVLDLERGAVRFFSSGLAQFQFIEDDLRKTTHAVYHRQKSHDG